MERQQRIVVGVDGSAGGDHALRWAVEEGAIRSAKVVAILAWGYLDQHAPPGVEGFDPHYGEEKARAALDAYVTRVLGSEAASVERAVVCDLPARALLGAVGPEDLLVVGARGRGGFRGLLLGSVSQRCVHLAATPLVVVREVSVGRHDRIVVGVDGSDASRTAWHWAIEESRLRQTNVLVVHAWHEYGIGLEPFGMLIEPEVWETTARALLDDLLKDLDSDQRERVEPMLVHGGPASALVAASRTADLLVVGNHGHGTFGRLVGSVAQQVSHHAHCPLALIPTPRAD
jgi:nucleotide-binding universal stress UspA family protein